jgi:RNA-binding protein
MDLTGKQRQHLRALAHHLDPVVQIGQRGVTEAVLRQLDDALETHELIKVKVGKESPDEGPTAAAAIQAGTQASVVQILGRTMVVYRAREKDPKIQLPKR